jgi:hypothetical protein
MSVIARYENFSSEVTGYTISPNRALVSTDIAVTVSYSEGNVTKTASVAITVAPKVLQSITITHAPDNISYTEGQTFSAIGLVVTANYEYLSNVVTTYEVDRTAPLVPSDTEVTLTYTENGVTMSVTVAITVAPKTLQGIEITTPPAKTEYIEGEAFNPSGLVVTAVYEYMRLPITTYSLPAATQLTPSDTEITVGYSENGVSKQAVISITVAPKTLQSISITNAPANTGYTEGQTFSTAGLVITANYEFLSEVVTGYAVSKTIPLSPTDTEITVSYTHSGVTKTANIAITVAVRTLQSIEITALPSTTAYVEGQVFDPSGMAVIAHYEYMSLAVTNSVEFATTPLTISDTSVYISYTENGTTKMVSVFIEIADNLLERVEIVTPANKLSYSSGETLTTVGLVLKAHYTNGTSKIVGGFSTDKPNPLTTGDILVTVIFTEASRASQVTKTTVYAITVTERVLESVEITTQPTKLSYVVGELFNGNDLVLTAHYSGGTTQAVTNYMVNKTSALSASDTQILVTYVENGITKQAAVSITVAARVLTGLEVAAQPNKTEYKATEKFRSNGLVIVAVYNNGAYTKTVTNYTVDKTNIPLITSDGYVVVTYVENEVTKTVNVLITVTARTLTDITIASPATKLTYNEGEYLDILGLFITAEYSDAPNAVVTSWSVDKINALTTADTAVTITYVESGVMKTVTYDITVNAVEVIEAEVQAVITAITSLPSVENLALSDKPALLYVGGLYSVLTSSQKDKVTNTQKLLALLDKMIELEAEVTPEPETEYALTYALYGDLSFSDIDFTGEGYPGRYKNSAGTIALGSVSSAIAAAQGYEFIKWVDESGDTVTHIGDLDTNKTYYAVFELTATVNVVFKDYADKTTVLLSLDDIDREEFNLIDNAIESAVFSNHGLLPIAYYAVNIRGEAVRAANNKFATDYNATIIVYVVTAQIRLVKITPEYDFNLSYVYEYVDDDEETNSANKTFTFGTEFIIPISASVTITVINPTITDIKLGGVGVGLVYPQTEYTFALSTGAGDLEITFTYYVAENVLLTFTGFNTRIYSYLNDGWNGKLSVADLSDVGFVFDENNNNYLNRYIINGVTYHFDDLADYVFSGSTTITVSRAVNEFDLTFVYTGGSWGVQYLVGKQTVGNSLSEFTAKTAFIDEIFANLSVFSDSERENAITKVQLLNLRLVDNVTLYIAARTAWTLTINNNGDEMPLSVLSDEGFDLTIELPRLSRAGFTFNGYSLTENGEVLTTAQILVIIANLNAATTIYALYEPIEGYEPPDIVDYSGKMFVGTWSATHNNQSGIIVSEIILNADGTYEYETKVNGAISVKLSGEYRLANDRIEIKLLIMDGNYQLINKSEFIVNIEWIGDNILIATCFTRSDLTINSYLHYLTNGQIRSANYNGLDLLGEYIMQQTSLAGGSLTTQNTMFTFYANGTMLASMQAIFNSEEVASLTENALFRITADGRLWVISNGSLGTMDITDTLVFMFVKSGQDYSGIATGSYIAANEESNSYAMLVEIHANGEISFVDQSGTTLTTRLNVISVNDYATVLQTDAIDLVEIEVINGGDTLIVTLNGTQIFYYNKVNG